ncbi:MAG: trypsin-like peptidase domain-containing protein [Sphingomonadaceae bacterium]|nr:trypsin-like peptidase domain-containing protein [Sphingomonadaceae bacterium]
MARWIALFALFLTLLPVSIAFAQDGDDASKGGDEEQAQQNDVVNASRSVVRVVMIGNDPERGQFFLGHGSGAVVADGYVVTNHHVVAEMMNDPRITILIVPSEGEAGFPGQVVTSDPRADLALITTRRGVIRPLPIFTGNPGAAARVAALGYPGNVDLAENLSVDDRVRPLPAVRTFGQLSSGRSRRDVDTLLHTAAIARGNSGGPLVDECGRIIGVNSFGAITEGVDAEFGFAISARELVPFLQNADIRPDIITDSCVPLDERERQAQQAEDRERDQTIQQVAERREIFLAVAVAMMVVGALLIGGGIVALIYRRKLRTGALLGWLGIIIGPVLMAGSVYVFLSRPSLADLEEAAFLIDALPVGVEISSG